MPSNALFSSSNNSTNLGNGSKMLVQFRAGRMNLRDRMLHPDTRKGMLYVYQSDDSLMHLCWKDRTTRTVEDDLIIFPEDCEYQRVTQCTTGRVYVLKFKSSGRNLFFWMQEPKTDKDDEWCRRINEVLNNPPPMSGGRSCGGGAPDGELQNILNNMSQHQLMQLFGGVGQIGGFSSLLGTMSRSSGQSSNSSGGTPTTSRPPSETTRAPSRPTRAPETAPTPTTPSTPSTPNTTTQQATNRTQPIHLSDLQKYLSGLTSPPEEGTSSDKPAPVDAVVDLAPVMNSAEVIATATPHAEDLTNYLPAPENDEPKDDIKTTLLSPQFAQAMSLFSNAVSSGQMGPVISQFGLGSDAVQAAQNGDMKAFIKALEEHEKKSQEESSKSTKKDEDENMSVD